MNIYFIHWNVITRFNISHWSWPICHFGWTISTTNGIIVYIGILVIYNLRNRFIFDRFLFAAQQQLTN
jgi:hypothetical protein